MIESWLPFFRWCESTALGRAVAESVWAFPILEAVHLLGLCVLGGALLVVDLRLLGAGLTSQTPAAIARHARPWLVAAIAVLVATGVPLFLSEAIKAFYNISFWVKMTTLPVALTFTFLVREPVARGEWGRAADGDEPDGDEGPAVRDLGAEARPGARERVAGAVSLGLWLVVAAAGRWIGFS